MITSISSALTLVIALQGAATQNLNQTKQDLVEQAKHCSIIANDKQRLSCFDAVFQLEVKEPQKRPMPFEKNPAPSDSVAPVVVLKPVEPKTPPQDAVQKFGADHLAAERAKETKLEIVTFTIEKVGLTLRKQQRFFFTNGQIWENKGSKELRVKEGDQVQIKDGALSAFYLSKVDGSRSVRVKRVK
jgi:hypothetical protein